MRHAPHEADARRGLVAFAAADDAAAGRRGPQIVDAQVQRRLVAEAAELHPDRHARRHVHEADDRPGGEHAGLAHADQSLAIVEAELDPILAVAHVEDAERAAMADAAGKLGEPLGVEAVAAQRLLAGHAASRAAVSRISAIMLGMPWVRLELSWLARSKGASAPSISVATISAAVRSCTASRTKATMPLVIAALLSARKWSRPSARGTG